MTIHSPARDFSAAAVVTLFGAGLAALSATYPLGSMFRPGPGFVPLAIGCLIVLLGIVIMFEVWTGVRRADEGPPDEGAPLPEHFGWRAVLSVSIGMLAFAFLVDRAGYVVASITLVLISSLGEIHRNWWAIGFVAVFMAVFGSVVFIWGLGLPVNMFGPR